MTAIALSHVGFFETGTRGAAPEVHERSILLHARSTCSDETPLPVGVLPIKVLDNPTGYLPEQEAVSSLVKKAAAHVHALAVLPIDEEAESVVDELITNARRRAGRRSLR